MDNGGGEQEGTMERNEQRKETRKEMVNNIGRIERGHWTDRM